MRPYPHLPRLLVDGFESWHTDNTWLPVNSEHYPQNLQLVILQQNKDGWKHKMLGRFVFRMASSTRSLLDGKASSTTKPDGYSSISGLQSNGLLEALVSVCWNEWFILQDHDSQHRQSNLHQEVRRRLEEIYAEKQFIDPKVQSIFLREPNEDHGLSEVCLCCGSALLIKKNQIETTEIRTAFFKSWYLCPERQKGPIARIMSSIFFCWYLSIAIWALVDNFECQSASCWLHSYTTFSLHPQQGQSSVPEHMRLHVLHSWHSFHGRCSNVPTLKIQQSLIFEPFEDSLTCFSLHLNLLRGNRYDCRIKSPAFQPCSSDTKTR